MLFSGRRVVNVNSTAAGGGVAELLQTLLAYTGGSGIDTRWVVIEGDPWFFEITKRIHNHLYGGPGDGGPLGPRERSHYEVTLARNAAALEGFLQPDDVVILHDPHTAGLVPSLATDAMPVVWRCHVGIDVQNDYSQAAWSFLRPYLDDVSAYVFSRKQFAPTWIPRARLTVIMPSIDPFSAKNRLLESAIVRRTLVAVGLASGRDSETIRYPKRDGTEGTLSARVDLVGTEPLPDADVPVVLQACRWDPMKNVRGVMTGFAEFVRAPHRRAFGACGTGSHWRR